jgi:hypothetical protein
MQERLDSKVFFLFFCFFAMDLQKEVDDLLELALNPNPKIRPVAIEQIAVLTGSEEGQTCLEKANVVTTLSRILFRTKNVEEVDFKKENFEFFFLNKWKSFQIGLQNKRIECTSESVFSIGFYSSYVS